MLYSFTQKSAKSVGLNIDLLRLKGELNCAAPVSSQNCLISGNCSVGAFTYFGKNCEIRNTEIGNYCSISAEVIINPFQHPINFLSTSGFAFGDNGGLGTFDEFKRIKSRKKQNKQGEVKIGNDVWIGRRAIIMAGVHIGDGAIIAANSVVTKDIPPYSIYGGVAAKLIRMRFDPNLVDIISKSSWFDYVLDSKVLGDIDYSNVIESVDIIDLHKDNLKKIEKNITLSRKNSEIKIKY
nr:CatB-related O-acetyltransferase [Psychrobacter fulvigenes]